MLPYFFHPQIELKQKTITLNADTSRHCIQVLRMQEGEELLLTDGAGIRVKASIAVADRKKCVVHVLSLAQEERRPYSLTLAIAFTKNNSRNEWLLEKATEMGVDQICPLICARSEKDKFNADRLTGILVSAMLQSQQCFLPELVEPVIFKKFIPGVQHDQKLMAHCIEAEERKSLLELMKPEKNTVILIGPEGDFTKDEIAQSIENGFQPVSLGRNRLRTETAGLYVCTAFNILNYA